MAEKQILAALQIESNEVRLLVGEVFNTRLNILVSEVVPCRGMDGIRITDQKAVASAIRTAVDNVTAHLGTPIRAVLLALPAYRFKRDTRSFSKMIESSDRRITAQDIQDIYHKALSVNVGSDVEVITITSNRYKTNGIVYRRMPIGEQCDVLEADVDLLCCDRMTSYDYAAVVEQAGLQIIDVCLDNYAMAKEAALFEQTMNNYLLAIQLEKQHTLFSLIYDGKIVSSENETMGYEDLAKPISEKFGLPERNSLKLLLKYVRFDQKEFNRRPLYSWTINQVTSTVSDRELFDAVKDAGAAMADNYKELCGPILEQENVTVLIGGAGTDIQGIDKLLADRFNRPVKCYYPETLGARNGRWTVCLGMFYAYIDQNDLLPYSSSSVNVREYTEHLTRQVDSQVHEEGFTARLKKMLFSNQKNG